MYLSTTRPPAAAPPIPATPDVALVPATSAAPDAQAGGGRKRRRVAGTVLALGTVSLVTDVSAEMVTAILPLYLMVGLGLSPMVFGLLDGFYNAATAAARLAGGHVADRWQRRKAVAAAGYALSAVAKLGLLAAGGSVTGIGGAIAADRVGKGIRTAPRDALISLSSHPDDLGRSFGVHRAMDTIGALAGPVVAFALLSYTAGAYDSVFVTSFCIAALGVLILLLFVSDRAAVPVERAATSLRAAFALLRSAAYRRVVVCATLLGLVTVSDAFLYLMLQQRLDLPVAYFPLLPLASAGVFLLLAVPLGRLADRIGRWRVFLGGYGLLTVVYALQLLPGGGFGLLIACLVLHGCFYAATDGVLAAAASATLPPQLRSSGLALVATGQSVGRLGASVAFGALWTLGGPQLATAIALGGLLVSVLGARLWRQA